MDTQLLEYLERFKNEIIYLIDQETDMRVKSDHEKGYFGRFAGGEEIELQPGLDVVTRAIFGKKEITRAQYNK